MAHGLWRYNVYAKEILSAIGTAGMVLVAASSPHFAQALVHEFWKAISRRETLARQRAIRNLKRKKFIGVRETGDGSIEVELTARGKAVLRRYRLEELAITKPKQWDRQWRMILYDIPHERKQARDAFREKLMQLGFYQLQKSVWVSPYECRDEILFLCGVFGIDVNREMLYFTVPHIPHEKAISSFFDL